MCYILSMIIKPILQHVSALLAIAEKILSPQGTTEDRRILNILRKRIRDIRTDISLYLQDYK